MTHPIAFPPPSTVPELALAKEVRAMFLGNEQGAWYDPSDMSTLFQDAAGTTPVTSVEQPVGLVLDKSKGLVLGPATTGTGWINAAVQTWDAFSTAGESFTATKSTAGSTDSAYTTNTVAVTLGAWYEVSLFVSSTTLSLYSVALSATTNSRSTKVDFSGTGLKKGYVYANVANGNFSINFSTTVLGSITVDYISVRELPGNHAFQTTAASRPVLSARVNRLLKTESPTEWINAATLFTVVNSEVGAFELSALTESTSVNAYIGQNSNYPIGTSLATPATIVKSIEVKKGSARYLRFGAASDSSAIFFDLENAVAVRNGGNHPVQITMLPDGWLRLEFWDSRSSWGASQLSYQMGWSPLWSGASLGTTDQIGSTVWFRNVSFVVESFNYTRPIRYQRVNTATDYDTAGFPMYLRFDGVDDGLRTNAINFTSTDKMTVFAGVRKLSDVPSQMIAEFGAGETAKGSWFLASQYTTSYNYFANSVGESANGRATATLSGSAPTQDVLSLQTDLSGSILQDRLKFRKNGGAASSVGGLPDSGSGGNHGNHALWIGRKSNGTLPFNGHLYQLIVRGAQSTPSQIQAGERWTNNRTGAY